MKRFQLGKVYLIVVTILILFFFGTELLARGEELKRRERREFSQQFDRACQLYEDENYWDAHLMLRDLSRSYSLPSEQKDSVDICIIRSLVQLGLREHVSDECNRVIREGTSQFIPEIRLLLFTQAYYEGNSYRVEMEYREIVKLGNVFTDEVRYYYGQSLFYHKKLDSAKIIFQEIADSSSTYLFAQHTIGVIFALQNQFDSAFYYHSIVDSHTPSTPSELEIGNLSQLHLGIIHYEGLIMGKRDYFAAEQYLQKISCTSSFYKNALLIRMWCALHQNHWRYMELLCDEMKREINDTLLIAEANLLLCRSPQIISLEDGTFDKNVFLIEEATELVEQYRPILTYQLQSSEWMYYDTRGRLFDTMERVLTISRSGELTSSLEELDSLKTEYLQLAPIVKNSTFDSFDVRINPFHQPTRLLDDLRFVQARLGLFSIDIDTRYHLLLNNVESELEILTQELDKLVNSSK